jgi:hypothetical protein
MLEAQIWGWVEFAFNNVNFDKLTHGLHIGANVNQQPRAHGTRVMTRL